MLVGLVFQFMCSMNTLNMFKHVQTCSMFYSALIFWFFLFSRGIRSETALVPPIRQTASIFKQPVTVHKNQEGKVKTDFKHGRQEKPRQVNWRDIILNEISYYIIIYFRYSGRKDLKVLERQKKMVMNWVPGGLVSCDLRDHTSVMKLYYKVLLLLYMYVLYQWLDNPLCDLIMIKKLCIGFQINHLYR